MYVPPGFSAVTPYLFVADGEAYARFLAEGLGGREIGRSLRPDGSIANCQVALNGATIMFSQAAEGFAPSQAALYFFVEDADAATARAVAAGAKLIMEVGDMPYGDRQGGILDPAGITWWISQRLEEKPYF